MEIYKEDIIHSRFLKSGIITPFNNIEECISNLFGIQSQVQQFGEISIFNRVANINSDDLNKMYKSNDIIKIWAQRMTVHMFHKNDWKIVHQVFSGKNNFIKKTWLGKEKILNGILSEIEKLAKKGITSKAEIFSLIEKNAPEIINNYRDYSIILQSTLNGLIFGIPENPQTKKFAHRNNCINENDFLRWKENKELSIEYILLRYFKNYGSATLADFCHWSGLTKREIQNSFNKIKDDLCELEFNNKTYFLPKSDEIIKNINKKDNFEFVKLLGKFDPLFVSFSDKSWIITPEHQKAIWRPAAHIEAVLIINEDVVGTWRYKIKAHKIDFNFFTFRNIKNKEKELIENEVNKISSFISKKLNTINYN